MLAKAYQKYLYIPRPVSKRYPMDVQHRAKQFAPYSASYSRCCKKQSKGIIAYESVAQLDRATAF